VIGGLHLTDPLLSENRGRGRVRGEGELILATR